MAATADEYAVDSPPGPEPRRSLIQRGMHAFMVFWYGYVRALNRALPTIDIDGKTLDIAPGVYKPLENEHHCVAYARPGDRVLDLGCGSGVNTVFVAPHVREVLAVDIAAAAVRNTEANCARHGIANVVVRQSDMFDGVDGKFDLILANPPYIAEAFEDEEAQFATSVRFLPTLFREAPQHLAEGGRLLVQFPRARRRVLEAMAAANGLELVSMKRTPLKDPGLFLLSLLYMQVGWRSTFYLWRARQDAAVEPVRAPTAALRSLTAAQAFALCATFPVLMLLALVLLGRR